MAIRGADVSSKILRAQRWNRADLFAVLFTEHGYGYSAADVERTAHLLKTWRSLRDRLDARSRREGRGRTIERIRERIREVGVPDWFWDALRRMPRTWNPFRGFVDWGPYLEGLARGFGAEWSPELLEALLRVLGELTEEFLAELQAAGRFEIPAPVISLSPGAGLPAGAEVLDVGRSVAVELSVGAGLTRTRQSVIVSAPVVVERVAVWADAAAVATASRVQVVVTPAGAAYAVAAAPAEVAGVALFEATDAAGTPVRSLTLQAVRTFAEFWPRRVVPAGPVRVTVTVESGEAATRVYVVGVDGRDVRLAS